MKYRILLGSVKADRVYKTGEVIELSDKEGKSLIREGVVEVCKECEENVLPTGNKPEKEVKEASVQPEKSKKEAVEAMEVAPSKDWTYKELEDYAKSIGLEVKEEWNKEKLWEALEAFRGGEVE